MAISIYDQFVPVFSHMLQALDKVLSKAEADAAARKIDLEVFVNGRLAPDMLSLVRQIQIMTDQAKGCASRLAGQDPPKWADDEKTFADLHARVAKIAPADAEVVDDVDQMHEVGAARIARGGASSCRAARGCRRAPRSSRTRRRELGAALVEWRAAGVRHTAGTRCVYADRWAGAHR